MGVTNVLLLPCLVYILNCRKRSMGWNLECDVTKRGEVGKHPLRKVTVVNFSHSTRTIKDKKSIFRLVCLSLFIYQ